MMYWVHFQLNLVRWATLTWEAPFQSHCSGPVLARHLLFRISPSQSPFWLEGDMKPISRCTARMFQAAQKCNGFWVGTTGTLVLCNSPTNKLGEDAFFFLVLFFWPSAAFWRVQTRDQRLGDGRGGELVWVSRSSAPDGCPAGGGEGWWGVPFPPGAARRLARGKAPETLFRGREASPLFWATGTLHFCAPASKAEKGAGDVSAEPGVAAVGASSEKPGSASRGGDISLVRAWKGP